MAQSNHTHRSRRWNFSEEVTVRYPPDAVPSFIDDDETTVRMDMQQMEFTAQASMTIDTALLSIRRTN